MSVNEHVIIGGGGTGEMALIYLAQAIEKNGHDARDLKLHLIDPNGFGCGGIAYGQSSVNNLLNSVRTEMSPWDTYEFHDWCVNQRRSDNAYEFNDRADYGLFLQYKVQKTIDFLENAGAKIIEHKRTAAIAFSNKVDNQNTNARTLNVFDAEDGTLLASVPANHVLLTPGYGPNENFTELWSNPNYVHNPYNATQIDALLSAKPMAQIIVAGTNAALNDITNSLSPHAGDVSLTAISQINTPLAVRDTSVEDTEQSLKPTFFDAQPPTNLAQLKSLLLSEFTDATKRQGRTDRRIGLDIMRHLGTYLQSIDPDLTRDLIKERQTIGHVARAATPVPSISAQNLQSFNPSFVKGRLNSDPINGNITAHDNGTFTVAINGEDINADIIINATGHGRHNTPILAPFITQGLIEFDDVLNTYITQEDTITLKGQGVKYIGPATHFGTDGMESNAGKTALYAQQVAAQLTAHKPENAIPTYNISKTVELQLKAM